MVWLLPIITNTNWQLKKNCWHDTDEIVYSICVLHYTWHYVFLCFLAINFEFSSFLVICVIDFWLDYVVVNSKISFPSVWKASTYDGLEDSLILWLPWWLGGYRICLQCRKPGFDPWVRKIPCRREWLLTQVFLTKEFYGQRNLADYSPKGRKELDTTEWINTHTTGLLVVP